jgi:hypothetical protein
VPSLKPTSWVLLGAGVLVGGFLFWLQVGLVGALAGLGLNGVNLQGHLSAAANYLVDGDYQKGEAEYFAAQDSADAVVGSSNAAPLALIGAIPGVNAAVLNWQRSANATGAITQTTGDLISLYGDLSGETGGEKIFSDGAINMAMLEDLPNRVNASAANLKLAQADLESIQANTIFAQTLDGIRDKALREMEKIQEAVASLEGVAPVLPDALGANGVRRYLIALGNQAEMRASGGAPLTLVMVELDNGKISIPIKGQTSTQLFPPLNAPVKWYGPALNTFFPGNPRNAPFVVTNTHPSLLMSGREMMGAWQGGSFPAVDGVVYLDLTAIAAVLTETGPIQSQTYGSVTGDQLGQILLVDAYADFGQEDATVRQAANQQLVDDLLTRILSGDDLVKAASAIAGTAPGRHFQLYMKNPALEQLALDAGAAGVVASPQTGDWSAMYTQNGNQSKVDVFQQRNVAVTVNLEADGSARVNQQMTMVNATPADRDPGPEKGIGYETMWIKNAYLLYIPDAARDYQVSYPSGFAVRPFKGHSVQQFGQGWVDDGYGNKLIRVVGWTPPGGQAAVGVSYTLPAGTFLDAESGELVYEILADPQGLFISPTVTVSVKGPQGWSPVRYQGMDVKDENATVSAVLDASIKIRVEFTQ